MKAIVGVALLALFAGAALADVKPSSTWLKDYLAPSEDVSAMSYSHAEKTTSCFQQSTYCYNGCGGTTGCSNTYELATMACARCHTGDYYSNKAAGEDSTPTAPLSLSKCLTNRDLFAASGGGVPIEGTIPGLSWVGDFSATCFLYDTSRGCLPAGCDKITVEIQGTVFNLDQAIRQGPLNVSASVCPPPSPPESVDPPPDGTVLVGPVQILSGQIVATSHPDKFEGGSYQYAWFTNRNGLVSTPPSKVPTLLPIPDELHKFEFIRERKPHS